MDSDERTNAKDPHILLKHITKYIVLYDLVIFLKIYSKERERE